MTPRSACSKNKELSSSTAKKYNTTYLNAIAERLVKPNPGLNLTTSDVNNLFSWCAYEINVRGSSPFCDLFTNEEFIKNSYGNDLSKYYSNGAGNNYTRIIGSVILNSSLELLKDTENSNQVWLSFAHDTDLEIFHSALGLLEPAEDLPTSYIPFLTHTSILLLFHKVPEYTQKNFNVETMLMLDTLSTMLSCQFQNVLLVQGSLVNLMILKISLKKELEMLTLLNNVVSIVPTHLSLLSTGIIKMSLTMLL